MTLPLEGIRVLSQGLVWAGPFLTLILGDLGAEVIEVESIHHLNPTRTNYRNMPPAFVRGPRGALYADRNPEGNFWDRYAVFNYGKRNCKSVTLNLLDPKGRDLFLRLVEQSDVYLENNAAHVVEKLRIDYPDLSAVNPRLVMLRFNGFGLSGPYKYFKGFGANVEAVAGHTAIRGYRDADPSMTSPIYHADPTAAAQGAFAIMTALNHRVHSGQGQLIDMSQAESVLNHLIHAFMDYSMNQRVQPHWGNRSPSMAPHGVFPCRGEDRWIAIAVRTDEAFYQLCRVMGRAELAEDDRFNDVVSRFHHQDELEAIIGAWTQGEDDKLLMVRLQEAGVPAAAVMHPQDIHADPHLQAREFLTTITHPAAGTHPYPRPMARFSRTPLEVRMPAPTLGQHNAAVLKGLLGVSDADYQDLLDCQIIGDTYVENPI